MRLIKTWMFDINGRTPKTVWIELIQRFLRENGLTSHRFLYLIDEMLFDYTIEEALTNGGCAKIRKACPALDEIRVLRGRAMGAFDHLWISNVDREDDRFTAEQILPVMNKIQRGHNISLSYFEFADVDFFGRRIHYEVLPRPERWSQIPHYGSCLFLIHNRIELSVDILHDGELLDGEPYKEALQAILPPGKVRAHEMLWLSREEKEALNEAKQNTAPVRERCRRFFEESLPPEKDKKGIEARYSTAAPMKKLAAQYGYTYRSIPRGGLLVLEKRTARGNAIWVEVGSMAPRYGMEIVLRYKGAGFAYYLVGRSSEPKNQKEANAELEKVMEAVAEFEKTLLPEVDACFPEAPAWYDPTMEPLWE